MTVLVAGDVRRGAAGLLRRSHAALLAVACVACSSTQGTQADDSPRAVRSREILLSIGQNVAMPLYATFRDRAQALDQATAALAAAPGAAAGAAAQAAWIAAMAVWQQAELTQFGPAAMSSALGGKELRVRIYSWPITSACRVDQFVLSKAYENATTLAAENVNVLGLDALEYLLFHTTPENDCPPNLTINMSGEWTTLAANPTELEQRRATFAAAVAKILVADAQALVDAWDPAKGNFLRTFSEAGLVDGYDRSQDAINAVGQALVYLDTETKDMKLAEPAAIANCLTATCPRELESFWGDNGRDQVLGNLRGFRAVFTGGLDGAPGLGLDDLLTDLGSGAVATDMGTRLDASEAAVSAITPTLKTALDTNLQAVRHAYAAVKTVTDLYKADVTTLLDLESPNGAPADND